MIRFEFTINKSFLKYRNHPITIPSDYNKELRTVGLTNKINVSIVWPSGQTTEGYIFTSLAGPGRYPYYQICARGKVPTDLTLNQKIGVEVRQKEGFRVLLHSDTNGPWANASRNTPVASDIGEPEPTLREECNTYRILRDTNLARQVKAVQEYKCQICGVTLLLGDRTPYAEAHHIKPLGSPHNGPDIRTNIICVCPNHHVLLDYGAIRLEPTKFPQIAKEYIDYHNSLICVNVAVKA